MSFPTYFKFCLGHSLKIMTLMVTELLNTNKIYEELHISHKLQHGDS